MSVKRSRTGLGNGIFLTALTDEKFKTNGLIVRFLSPLTEENAAANACIPFAMEDTCRKYPDMTAFNRRLTELYGANVRGGVSRFAGGSAVGFASNSIADRYALGGEHITYDTLSILLDCITDPVLENGVLPKKQFLLKRRELIDDINADINDKRLYALKRAGRFVFEGEPSGIAVKGEPEAAEALTPETVTEAWKKMLRSSRAELSFVGKELSPQCLDLIKERFGAIEREEVYLPRPLPSPHKDKTKYVTEHLDVVQSKMVIALKYHASPEETAAVHVACALYGGTPFSMLFKNVRERLSLCYYCSASNHKKQQTVFVDCGVESENIEPAREEILRQLDLIRKGEFDDELLSRTKLSITSALKGVEDSPRAVSDWYLDRCLEEPDTPAGYAEKINAVTREQVTDIAGRLVTDTVYVLDRE